MRKRRWVRPSTWFDSRGGDPKKEKSNTERKRGELTGPMFQFSGDDLYFLLPPGGEGRNRRRKGKRRSGGGKKKQALGFA